MAPFCGGQVAQPHSRACKPGVDSVYSRRQREGRSGWGWLHNTHTQQSVTSLARNHTKPQSWPITSDQKETNYCHLLSF